MKKNIYLKSLIAVAVLLIIIAATVIRSLWNDNVRVEKSPATMRIAAIFPYYNNQYWIEMCDGMTAGAEGIDVDIKVYYPDVNYDIAQMVDLIRQAVVARVDAIIVQGADDEAYVEILKTAQKNGILIAFIDTDNTSFENRVYVGTDNYMAGQFMGACLTELVGVQANVAVFRGASGFPNLDQRLQGLQDTLKDYPGIQVITIQYTQYDTMTIIEKYYRVMRDYKNVDTIVCLDGTGGMAFGSLLGPAAGKIEHILCFDIGLETEAALKNGVIDGTVVQQQHDMGEIVVKELYRRFQEGDTATSIYYTGVRYVTAGELEADHGQ